MNETIRQAQSPAITKGPRFREYSRDSLRNCPYLLLSIEEWARFNSVGRTLAYQMAKNNEINGLLKRGRKYYVSLAATLKDFGEEG